MALDVTPEPKGHHVDVFGSHFAILFAETSPASVKIPPTYRVLFESISKA